MNTFECRQHDQTSDLVLQASVGYTTSLPTGPVTFLYTDIDGSTQRWERAPSAMRVALKRHHAIVRASVGAHRGDVYQIIGDAFVAVFSCASDALHAALAAQRALLAEPWAAAIAPLRVRMALHHGHAYYQDDGYHAEESLNRLSRLLCVCYGSQIVLTADVHNLINDAWPPGVYARDLGRHQLRDLIAKIHVWQVVAPDLPSEFPPLRSLNNPPADATKGHNRAVRRRQSLLNIRRSASAVGFPRR
jgi:class 3 adenylate cyclase